MMSITPQYIIGFILVTLIGIWYERWRKANDRREQEKTYELVKQYLLNDSSLAASSKPLLWIHIPHEINARHWADFYSRNNTNVNKPYLYLTIKSIVDKCGDSFNICLINDDTFDKIIPGWTIDLERTADPVKCQLRMLALSRVLYYYGGLLVPPSLLCFNNLNDAHYNALNYGADALVGEFMDTNVTSEDVIYAPNPSLLLGCKKHSEVMKEYGEYLENLISRDYTAQWKFMGSCSSWWTKKVNAGQAALLGADVLGVETPTGPMTAERLLGSTFYTLAPNAVALYIPEDELSKRLNYRWFERQSPEQVLRGNYLIGMYFLSSLTSQ